MTRSVVVWILNDPHPGILGVKRSKTNPENNGWSTRSRGATSWVWFLQNSGPGGLPRTVRCKIVGSESSSDPSDLGVRHDGARIDHAMTVLDEVLKLFGEHANRGEDRPGGGVS